MRFLADFAPESFERSGRKSLTQALMRFLTDSVLETFEKHGFAGPAGKRAKASTERGCRDTTPMSWSSWLASFLIPSKNMGLLAVLGGGRVSYVMRFLTDFVLETCEKHGLAGRQSSAANIVDRSPFDVPGRFCSRNVWKTWVCWLFWGGQRTEPSWTGRSQRADQQVKSWKRS